jgi:hypothetical protein
MTSPLVKGEETMRLSALRSSVAGVLESKDKKRAARTAGTFLKQSGSQWSEIAAAHTTRGHRRWQIGGDFEACRSFFFFFFLFFQIRIYIPQCIERSTEVDM